jgi:hypothetical protein
MSWSSQNRHAVQPPSLMPHTPAGWQSPETSGTVGCGNTSRCHRPHPPAPPVAGQTAPGLSARPGACPSHARRRPGRATPPSRSSDSASLTLPGAVGRHAPPRGTPGPCAAAVPRLPRPRDRASAATPLQHGPPHRARPRRVGLGPPGVPQGAGWQRRPARLCSAPAPSAGAARLRTDGGVRRGPAPQVLSQAPPQGACRAVRVATGAVSWHAAQEAVRLLPGRRAGPGPSGRLPACTLGYRAAVARPSVDTSCINLRTLFSVSIPMKPQQVPSPAMHQ